MGRLQAADPRGGMLQVTRGARELPWEFHAWPAVAGSAWQVLVLADAGLLWAPLPEPAEPEPVTSPVEQLMPSHESGASPAGFSQTLAYVAPRSGDGFSVTGDAGTLQLSPEMPVSVGADEAASGADNTLVFAQTARETDTVLTGLPAGVRATTRMRGEDAPTEYAWSLADPQQRVVAGENGGAVIRGADGAVVADLAPPTAVDASGREVPAALKADRDSIRLHVAHGGDAVEFPVAASFEVTAALMPPDGPGTTPDCDGHYEDQRPFLLDIDTVQNQKGPGVRWGVKLSEEHVAALAALGHVTANFRGHSEVQSSTTSRMVNLGGPEKRFVLINRQLHSSIYKLNKKAGHWYLRWGDYVQMFTTYRSRSVTLGGLFTGRTSFACEPRQP